MHIWKVNCRGNYRKLRGNHSKWTKILANLISWLYSFYTILIQRRLEEKIFITSRRFIFFFLISHKNSCCHLFQFSCFAFIINLNVSTLLKTRRRKILPLRKKISKRQKKLMEKPWKLLGKLQKFQFLCDKTLRTFLKVSMRFKIFKFQVSL